MTGAILTVAGLGAFGVDFVTRGEFAFLSDHYEVSLLAILTGVVLLLISLIGWAAVLGKVGRTRIAFFSLTVSIGIISIGYALGGTNVHGPFYLFLLPMAPLIIVGLVVAIMAANARA
jgi:hypothetical protein